MKYNLRRQDIHLKDRPLWESIKESWQQKNYREAIKEVKNSQLETKASTASSLNEIVDYLEKVQNDDDKDTDEQTVSLLATNQALIEALKDDLDTPGALTIIDEAFSRLDARPLSAIHQRALVQLLETIDEVLGLQLVSSTPDISDESK